VSNPDESVPEEPSLTITNSLQQSPRPQRHWRRCLQDFAHISVRHGSVSHQVKSGHPARFALLRILHTDSLSEFRNAWVSAKNTSGLRLEQAPSVRDFQFSTLLPVPLIRLSVTLLPRVVYDLWGSLSPPPRACRTINSRGQCSPDSKEGWTMTSPFPRPSRSVQRSAFTISMGTPPELRMHSPHYTAGQTDLSGLIQFSSVLPAVIYAFMFTVRSKYSILYASCTPGPSRHYSPASLYGPALLVNHDGVAPITLSPAHMALPRAGDPGETDGQSLEADASSLLVGNHAPPGISQLPLSTILPFWKVHFIQ
jgi:hypothetical protein